MTPIPQCNPAANTARHLTAILKAVEQVVDGGRYILGDACEAFETAFARYNRVSHCVGVGNGTDAIELILRALGVGHGDRVATVSNTAVATVAAIARTGASPRFADIDPSTFNMCPQSLNRLLDQDRGIKAIVAVHLYGYPADIEELMAIADAYNVPVVEDCAQAHGAMVAGRKVGAFGVAGAFSFYPTKNLGALGDGGAVVTSNRDLAEQIRMLRQYGWRERYVSEVPGINSRLDEMQAAILLEKLPFLEEENGRRREIALRYEKGLTAIAGLTLPLEQSGAKHVYHQFVVRVQEREVLVQCLREAGIGTAIHYPVPVHYQPAYRHIPRLVPLTATESCNREILSLPMFPELSDQQVDSVIAAVRRALGTREHSGNA